MNREYHKQYSHELGRDMESLVFGHGGQPTPVLFRLPWARYFEYEDSRNDPRAGGQTGSPDRIQVFCVDGVDGESWYNKSAHPRPRSHLETRAVRALHHQRVSAAFENGRTGRHRSR